jgi:hypothetical protein
VEGECDGDVKGGLRGVLEAGTWVCEQLAYSGCVAAVVPAKPPKTHRS